MSMRDRFEGVNAEQLIRALRKQPIIDNNEDCARAFAKLGSLAEFPIGATLTVQDAPDNGVYLVIAGAVSVVVNGAHIATRRAGESIGEMAAIEPSLPRSATVTAIEPTLALAIENDKFHDVGDSFGHIWRPMAQVLAKRLHERNRTIRPANASPKLFIISSSESRPIAHALREGLEHDVFSTVWDQGVFFAGGYPLEALEKQVSESDFAVAVAEPDDIVVSRSKAAQTLRDNVLFELGLFMGHLTRYRSILVHPRIKDLKIPSDLHGLTLIPYEAGTAPIKDRIAPVCDEMRKVVKRLGVRVDEFDV